MVYCCSVESGVINAVALVNDVVALVYLVWHGAGRCSKGWSYW